MARSEQVAAPTALGLGKGQQRQLPAWRPLADQDHILQVLGAARSFLQRANLLAKQLSHLGFARGRIVHQQIRADRQKVCTSTIAHRQQRFSRHRAQAPRSSRPDSRPSSRSAQPALPRASSRRPLLHKGRCGGRRSASTRSKGWPPRS